MNMKRAYGFTLIELMFTIVVAVVLLSLGIVSFKILMSNNRATTQANALYSGLNYARSEAIGRADTVTICPKSTANVASTTCGASTDWTNGWQVFADVNATGTYVSGDGDVVLKNWEPLPGTPTVTATSATTAASVVFDSDGSKRPVSQGEVTFAMSETDTTGDASRCVRVSVIGMVRVHKITASATCP